MDLPKWLRSLLPGSGKPDLSSRQGRGQFGEDAAARFLKREKGFRIITRNWRAGRHELDITAWDGPVLVFVEVRTRDADALVSGYHSITAKKKKAVLIACQEYLRQLPQPATHIRFDAVEVRLRSESDFSINHFANIPLFPKHFRSARKNR